MQINIESMAAEGSYILWKSYFVQNGLSRLIQPAFSLPISTQMIKAINKMHFKFIWMNKCQYIRKDDMVKKYEYGGVNSIDFVIMNGVQKLKWLK